MTKNLPDIAAVDIPANPMPLDWVGMSGIDLPVVIEEPGYRREHHARIDAEVNLPRPDVRGIHMSRLHQLVDELGSDKALTPGQLGPLLAAMIESHEDCDSNLARVRLSFDLLVRRGALESADIGGWRAYPVILEAISDRSGTTLRAKVAITYSSTCPCSASLTRQLVEREFLRAFSDRDAVSPADAAAWLREHATLATPHSQRSDAHVSISIAESAASFGLLKLIDRVESALTTPVQTAVKRIDEQAFAARNGQNLMFVEDAVRRIRMALARDYAKVEVNVAHRESLHPHDAVASAGP
ncbi:MAG: GTP cyclohydrolase FolE2 [Woeseiaceae bacterium]|nr:GTP cyclohydrolase FolE2 [Woeseiaceae bacterium]